MSKESYAKDRLDPLWQKCRLKVLEYAEFRCQLCGDKRTTLHVHHSYYLKGKKPWQYPMGSMIVLCEKCHKWVHARQKEEKHARFYEQHEITQVAPSLSPEKELLDAESAADFIRDMRRKLLEGA